MKTQTNITVWEILKASRAHYQAVLNALGKLKVTLETMPEKLVALIMPTKPKKLEIMFTNEKVYFYMYRLQRKYMLHNFQNLKITNFQIMYLNYLKHFTD